MIPTQEMTDEQRAVLRACEERFGGVRQVEDPIPVPPPSVFAEVPDGKYTKTLEIQGDGTTRAFCTGYMGVPIRLYGTGKRPETGVPKHAKKYLPT